MIPNRAPAALLACVCLASAAGVPAEPLQQWQQTSERGFFEAELMPRGGTVEIGRFQDWIITLQSSAGEPVLQAGIAVGGGMQDHGHGLPTQPQATRSLGGGRFLIEGVRFSMAGRWLLVFGVETRDVTDRILFEFDLDEWDRDEQSLLASLYLDPRTPPPPSPSNRVADNPDAARLGEKLFFDERPSGNGKISCASCHQPDRYFTDGLPKGVGINPTSRNTPTVIGAAHMSWFYWDGRRDSLWSQALIPFEAADEMGSSRVAVVRLVGVDREYRVLYERVFGAFPAEVLADRLPAHAGPLGDATMRDAWHRMPRRDAERINTVYANLGKAIAAYERTLPLPEARFDRYAAAVIAGDDAGGILSADERAGLRLFLDSDRTHCLRCHNGPFFTNNGFHNIGTGNFEGEQLDFGRVFGIRAAIMDEFNCVGPYSDAQREQCTELRFLNRNPHVPLEGAFKVPGLRNLAATAPYMHDGRFPDLESVIAFYRQPPVEGVTHELPLLDISDEEARQLISFLGSLTAER